MPQIVTNDGLVLPLPGPDPDLDPLTERRVVLVKPGDVLLIGNMGNGAVEAIDWESAHGVFDRLGLKVIVFAADIDLGLLPGGASGA